MLIYREQRTVQDTTTLLSRIRTRLCDLPAAGDDRHDRIVTVIIELGLVEAGVADALHPEIDAADPISGTFRRASTAAGHLLWNSWRGHPQRLASWSAQLEALLGRIQAARLPARIWTTPPEGYAYYGVYPETYLEAAEQAVRALGPRRVVCIGIRGIGTSLSGGVAAALEERGVEVLSLTVRPRGHPFDRRLLLSAELEATLRSADASHFLLVDEGPGISGSSLAGTARALSQLGIPDERIVLMPSWRTDGTRLRSPDARMRWRRHQQFTGSFEDVWLRSGRLAEAAGGTPLSNLSAGLWRRRFWSDPERYPATQPQHERRKFLASVQGDSGEKPAGRLLSFAGLGHLGAARLDRARALGEAGWGPAPVTLRHGFLIREFLPGHPLGLPCSDADLLSTMAGYLAHLRAEFPAETAPDLREMITTNVTEALGHGMAAGLEHRLRASDTAGAEPPTALDARMFPHEWIRTPAGYRKVDAVDHHDDHFYPGPQDIAWDVAGTCLEFRLDAEARRGFVDQYRRASGDREIARRLPFHALAYLAFRVGYSKVAGEVLTGSADGRRFDALAARYRAELETELADAGGERWNV